QQANSSTRPQAVGMASQSDGSAVAAPLACGRNPVDGLARQARLVIARQGLVTSVQSVARPDRIATDRRGTTRRCAPAAQRLMREIFVPSMLRLAIRPCWLKMKA